eukprot:gene32763-42422_t
MLHCLKAMIENCVSTIGSNSEMSERQAIYIKSCDEYLTQKTGQIVSQCKAWMLIAES